MWADRAPVVVVVVVVFARPCGRKRRRTSCLFLYFSFEVPTFRNGAFGAAKSLLCVFFFGDWLVCPTLRGIMMGMPRRISGDQGM